MEAATLRELHPTAYAPTPRGPASRAPPRPAGPTLDEDWDWVYDDPDLEPFRSGKRDRKETPLTAWA